MNLKPFVNDKHLFDDFLEELDNRITMEQRGLEQAVSVEDVYRYQGSIKALRSLKQLREKVNGAPQHG